MSDSAREKHESLGAGCLVVTPTYNERYNLPIFIQAVLGVAPAAHVLVVDDASPDGTGEVADRIAERDKRVSVLHRPSKSGLGTAYLDAFRVGLQNPAYSIFFEMDADLSHDPNYIPSFLNALEAGADAVIGSRNISGGGVEGWGLGRHVLSKGGSIYSRVILGADVRDLTSGYKAFSRAALQTIDLDRVRSNGYSFQIEMTYRALQHGLKVVEVPIVFVDRRAGDSKMSRRIFAEAVGVVWKLRWQALRSKL
ncbi:MAG: polyprenol monophosphomannose synthase [Polyangiaceae bacterium]|nr:polyprenol monophosphomannose synthase [Polyangiaceae bacterium]